MKQVLSILQAFVAFASFTCAVSHATCGPVTSEEATVHALYSKFIISMRVGSLMDGAEFPNEDPPRVDISDIRTGPISDIADTMLSALVSKPSGMILTATPGDWTRNDLRGVYRHAAFTTAHWQVAPYLTESWDVPFAGALEKAGLTSYSRFAAFKVRLSYQGQARQYAALFLFGNNTDGSSAFLPLDHIIGTSALTGIAERSILPGPLLTPQARARSAVRAFLRAIQAHPGCTIDAHTHMCCDADTSYCGIAAREFPAPLDTAGNSLLEQSAR